MEAPSSKLGKILENSEEQKKIVLEQIRATGSAVGAKVVLNGVKYVIIDGDYSLDNFYERVDNFKKEMFDSFNQ